MPPSILVVGSSNTDMIITAPRIPSPGETILGGAFSVAPGGKGANQAVAAARLGGAVTLVACIGTDRFGDESLSGYENDGIDTRYIARDKNTPSGIAMIMVDGKGENAIAVASGANMRLMNMHVDRATEAIVAADIVVLQLEIPYETNQYVAGLAAQHNVPVILNPAPARPLDEFLLRQIAYLTPNASEASLLTGIEVTDGASAHRAAKALLSRGAGTVIVTLGARGACWANADGHGLIPAPQVNVVDTTAAGDAFNGGLAVAIAQGQDLESAIRFANHAGALAVTNLGAQPSLPTLKEVKRLNREWANGQMGK